MGHSEESSKAFAAANVLWMRLQVEVIYNPNFKDHDACRKDALKAYSGPGIQQGNTPAEKDAWLYFVTRWQNGDSWWPSGTEGVDYDDDPAVLNRYIDTLNGIAKACLPSYSAAADAVKGVDVAKEHPVAAAVSSAAPHADILTPGGARYGSGQETPAGGDTAPGEKPVAPWSLKPVLYAAGGVIAVMGGIAFAGWTRRTLGYQRR